MADGKANRQFILFYKKQLPPPMEFKPASLVVEVKKHYGTAVPKLIFKW
jgi:hypothetical protein